MQDTTQDQNQTVQQGRQVQQPPVSSGNKEQSPVVPTQDVQLEEVNRPPEIPQELKDAGVEHGTDAKGHELSDVVKQSGVTHAKEATPFIPVPPTVPTNLSMSLEEALVEEKKYKSVKNGISWRIRIALRELKKTLLGKGEQ